MHGGYDVQYMYVCTVHGIQYISENIMYTALNMKTNIERTYILHFLLLFSQGLPVQHFLLNTSCLNFNDLSRGMLL